MTTSLAHRGPDDSGTWHDADAGVALGHRRLSIVDLSPAGHQPMASADGRFVLTYNGEIYSHSEIRPDLERRGVRFRGTSDTEVIVEACAAWGLEAILPRLIGMFAFGLWDRDTRTLTLVRDRLGIKPLYYIRSAQWVVFGSELKALLQHPGWAPAVDRSALAAYMRHNYVPAPFTIFQGVQKLEPGTAISFGAGKEPVAHRFWDLRAVVARAQRQRATDEPAALEQLETLLADAVRRRMVADVPLGALLSGGIDSSLVSALMRAQHAGRVRTFSIGFSEPGYDEAPFARAVARHIGTDHTELYVDPSHALDVIPRLPEFWDEPFADSSQIPTFLVCELTRRHVTVVLSGDGGDELFCGYARYHHAAEWWARTRSVPPAARGLLGRALRSVPPQVAARFAGVLPSRLHPARLKRRLDRLALAMEPSPDDTYRHMLSHWAPPESVVRGAAEAKGRLWDSDAEALVPDFIERMQYLDTLTYLPDDILTKVDRASMAVGLEARVPLIDHRVVEFAWSLPLHMKRRDGHGKWALRQLLRRYVPDALVERPKMGFGVPIDRWLRGPLRDWAECLLDEDRLRRQGLLEPGPVRERWQAHVRGEANWAYPLWNVLMLQAWVDRYPGVRV